jgi:acetolactate synthase-1/2/3 large subunit
MDPPQDSSGPLASTASSSASNLPPSAAARRLIEALVERGVDMFFGIPGGPVCPVFEAIRLTPGARLIDSRHETHAVFAAALYQRASGRVPAVVVTAGPGITNAVTGIASASLERVPLLVIAGDVAWSRTGACMAQHSGPEGIAMESLLRPITRAQVRSAHARSAVSQALSALDAALDPLRPGPALFVLPLDQAMQSCSAQVITRTARVSALVPPAEAVACTADWLANASRPLIVIGAGCRGHEPVLRGLIDATQLPFVTTPRAKGLISEQHPSSLRNGGMAASLWARRYTSHAVDVCLALGTDLDDTSMGPTPYLGAGGKLVHVDLDARVFGRNLPTALGVIADLGAFASALEAALAHCPRANASARAALLEARCEAPFDVANRHRGAHALCAPLPHGPHARRLPCAVEPRQHGLGHRGCNRTCARRSHAPRGLHCGRRRHAHRGHGSTGRAARATADLVRRIQ